jgi:hypothetical protein
MKSRKKFDKYYYYRNSVQSPEDDVKFLRKVYRDHRGHDPIHFREDFCGTFALCCEWIKLSKTHTAQGIDLDLEPLDYGRANYLPLLTKEQQARVDIQRSNVLWGGFTPADISVAMNFSYFIFKERKQLREYFETARKGLKKNGIFLVDLFGGTLCQEANEEKTKLKGFDYYWEQKNFDPLDNGAKYAIHFQIKGEKKREDVFTYDWRMWSTPELREIMIEAGFAKTSVYLEGTTKQGTGNGVFKKSAIGEECQSWIAYIVGEV